MSSPDTASSAVGHRLWLLPSSAPLSMLAWTPLVLAAGLWLMRRVLAESPSPNRKLRYAKDPAAPMTASEADVDAAVARLRAAAQKKKTSIKVHGETTEVWSAFWREQQLYGIYDMLSENLEEYYQAAKADVNKPYAEFVLEVNLVLAEILDTVRNIRKWMNPESVHTPLWLQPSSSYVVYEPFGVVLVVGAWNCPVQTIVSPLCAAIAAGNACLLKPNEQAAAQAAFYAKYLPRYTDPEGMAVVLGEASISKKCVESDIDMMFFTGSTRVGGMVAAECVKRHIPYVLELGGKCPCIIDPVTCDLTVMARRVVQTKTINAGQVCLAPDHAIILGNEAQAHRVANLFLIPELKRLYGTDQALKEDMTSIINDVHFNRLKKLLDGAREYIIYGGRTDASTRTIEPTILLVNASRAEKLDIFKEEIFGPILPIVYVSDAAQAIDFVNKSPFRHNPLAVYLFSNDSNVQRLVQSGISTGNMCINDCEFQAANSHLPFGGIKESGVGKYHGRHGFVQCSNAKAVMHRSDKIDPPLRYNPNMKQLWVQKALVWALNNTS